MLKMQKYITKLNPLYTTTTISSLLTMLISLFTEKEKKPFENVYSHLFHHNLYGVRGNSCFLGVVVVVVVLFNN